MYLKFLSEGNLGRFNWLLALWLVIGCIVFEGKVLHHFVWYKGLNVFVVITAVLTISHIIRFISYSRRFKDYENNTGMQSKRGSRENPDCR